MSATRKRHRWIQSPAGATCADCDVDMYEGRRVTVTGGTRATKTYRSPSGRVVSRDTVPECPPEKYR